MLLGRVFAKNSIAVTTCRGMTGRSLFDGDRVRSGALLRLGTGLLARTTESGTDVPDSPGPTTTLGWQPPHPPPPPIAVTA
jgi:hypothetical protein